MNPNNPIEITPNADVGRPAQRSTDKTLDKLAEQASALAQRGVDAMRDRSQQVREQALRASDNTLNYIKDEPVKAVLIAAVTGAALMALIGLLRKSN